MAAYVKSAVWLLGCSGIGYVLLVAATPSQEHLATVSKTYPGVEKSPVESINKKQQFVNVLQAVTETNQPLHRLSKSQIEDLSTRKTIIDIMQDRCDKITNILNRRELERKLDIEKKREDKKQGLAEHENIDFFEKTFSEERLEIENALNSSLNLDPGKLPTHFDTISKNILNLQKYVASSNIFLRTYDIKMCHQSLQELNVKVRELEDKLLPKKKFGFKNKSKLTAIEQQSNQVNGHSNDEVDFHKRAVINLNENFCGYENKASETLKLENSKIFKKDVTLKNLEHCVIKINGSPSTLHLSHLKNCLLLSGPVSTSIFAENCTDCKLVIACQQLRLHSSTDIQIYLHVTSRAIMEDCHKILVAPYNLKYEGLAEHFANSGLDINTNNWTSIDDFNWLNTEKQSPNWNILKENERISDWSHFALPAG